MPGVILANIILEKSLGFASEDDRMLLCPVVVIYIDAAFNAEII